MFGYNNYQRIYFYYVYPHFLSFIYYSRLSCVYFLFCFVKTCFNKISRYNQCSISLILFIYKLQVFVQSSFSLMKQSNLNSQILNKNEITSTKFKGQIKTDRNAYSTNLCSNANGLLKFMDNPHNNRANRNQGIRCLSNNTYGVSHDSPDCFKLRNTVVINSPPKRIKNSYEKNINPETEPLKINFKTQQKFYPMKNYFHVKDQHSQQLKTQFTTDYMNTLTFQQKPFNLVSNQYTGFIETNVLNEWKDQYPLMGFQRSNEARKLNNKDRTNKIQQKQTARQSLIKTFYQSRRSGDNANNPHYPKQAFANTYYSKTSKSKSTSYISGKNKNNELFTFKSKIRSSRIQLANKLKWDTNSYLIKEKSEDKNGQHFIRSYFNTGSSFSNRPATGKPNLYKNKVNLTEDMHKLDNILSVHGDKNHKRTHSTLQCTNLAEERNEQMVQKIEQWSNKTQMHNLSPCQSLIKRRSNQKLSRNPIK